MTALPAWLEPLADQHLAGLIDHTLLKAEAAPDDITRLCDEATRLGLGTVCVNGQWVATAARRLGSAARRAASGPGVATSIAAVLTASGSLEAPAPSHVRLAAVVGFPLGASGPRVKAAETLMAVAEGATEIDVVLSLGWAKAGEWKLLQAELRAVTEAAHTSPVKVIVETAALSPDEIEQSCAAAVAAGAAFVKTSTGFHPAGGATLDAVALLRRSVGTGLGVKASGGIRTVDDAVRMLLAGADRIGTSAAATWDPADLSRRIGDLR